MTRFIYDQFSKDYLETLLLPYGDVEIGKTVASEIREIDLWFAPNKPTLYPPLGLLGRFAQTPAVFEPYRNPVTAKEINDCLSKLSVVREESQREANRRKQRVSEENLPRLWILTPTASQSIIESFGGRLKPDWEKGIYFLAESFRTAIVVIHQLPTTTETLWLRLLGREGVKSRAIDELEALAVDHPLRSIILELLYNLRRNLVVAKYSVAEDRELIMRLAPLYQQDREQAIQEGIQQGEVNLVLRQLDRRLGSLSTILEDKIRELSVEQLNHLGEALLDFTKPDDLDEWMRSRSVADSESHL